MLNLRGGLVRKIFEFKPILIDLTTFVSPWVMILIARDLIDVVNKSQATPGFHSKTGDFIRSLLGEGLLTTSITTLLLAIYFAVATAIILYLVVFYSFCFYQSTSPRWGVVLKCIGGAKVT